MFTIEFYKDKAGNEPIAEYIRELNEKAKKSKEHRIHLKKILEYLRYYPNMAPVPAPPM